MANSQRKSDANMCLAFIAECFATAPCKEQEGSFHIKGAQLSFLKEVLECHIKTLDKAIENNVRRAAGQGPHNQVLHLQIEESVKSKIAILETHRDEAQRNLEDPETAEYLKKMLTGKLTKLNTEISKLQVLFEES